MSTAQSLNHNRYTEAKFMTGVPCGLNITIHHSPILSLFSQPRGAEQRPCSHDRGLALADLDHAATDEPISTISDQTSGMLINRTSTGHLPLAHSRSDRLEKKLHVGGTIAGSNIHSV